MITLNGLDVMIEEGIDISISVIFNDQQLACTAFGLLNATSRRIQDIDVKTLKGCVCDEITFCAHAHCTHIESKAHVDKNAKSTLLILTDLAPLLFTKIIDITNNNDNTNNHQDACQESEIEAIALYTGAVTRQSPDEHLKVGFHPLERETLQKILLCYPKLKVLLIDSVSIDPEKDQGMLMAHRMFFDNLPNGLIVELCLFPTTLINAIAVKPMYYALDLNAGPFDSDAIPCRPILYPLHCSKAKI